MGTTLKEKSTMASQKQYRSRLKGKGKNPPTRGMGSGFAVNQAMAGADDPENAASLAALSEAEMQKRVEDEVRMRMKRDEKIEYLQGAIMEGDWNLPEGETFEDASDETLDEWLETVREEVGDQIDEETAEEVDQLFSLSPEFDPDDPLYNPIVDTRRRARIEKGLAPLDFDQMVFKGYCDQDVTLREGFTITFRTISTIHGLWLEMDLTKLAEYSAQYGRHWFSLLQIGVSVQKINGKALGTDLSRFTDHAQKEDFKKALDEKMKVLGRLPSVITDDLIVQHTWFTGRVRKLMAGDILSKVGNS
jgi:hypothetical protein